MMLMNMMLCNYGLFCNLKHLVNLPATESHIQHGGSRPGGLQMCCAPQRYGGGAKCAVVTRRSQVCCANIGYFAIWDTLSICRKRRHTSNTRAAAQEACKCFVPLKDKAAEPSVLSSHGGAKCAVQTLVILQFETLCQFAGNGDTHPTRGPPRRGLQMFCAPQR